MLKSLKSLLFPFSVVAKELTILRELYELDLASRTPQVIRITEKPRASDTEVSYMGDEKKESPSEQLIEAWQREQDDDYDDN